MAFFACGETGTTVIHLGKTDIDTFRFLKPDQGLLDAFARIVEPLFERTAADALEVRTLAQPRDTLLPMLLGREPARS